MPRFDISGLLKYILPPYRDFKYKDRPDVQDIRTVLNYAATHHNYGDSPFSWKGSPVLVRENSLKKFVWLGRDTYANRGNSLMAKQPVCEEDMDLYCILLNNTNPYLLHTRAASPLNYSRG